MKCPHCSFENRPDAPFCENCGEVFPARMDIPEIKTPSTDAKRRGEVLSDVPPIVKVPEIPRPEVKRAVPEEGAAPLPDPVDIPDLSGFERLVDSSYIPPVPRNSAGDTAELPRIEEEYVPRARSYTLGLDPKEQRKRDREQKRLEKKFIKQQQKDEARQAKEQAKAAKAAQKAAAAEERAARKAAEEEERQARKAAEAEERAARAAEEARLAQEDAEAERRANEEAAALAAAETQSASAAFSAPAGIAEQNPPADETTTALATNDASAIDDAPIPAEEPEALVAAAGAMALAEPGITAQEAEDASLALASRSHGEEQAALVPANAPAEDDAASAGLVVATPAASGALSRESSQDTRGAEVSANSPAAPKERTTAAETAAPKASHSSPAQPSHGRRNRSKKPLIVGICALVLVVALAVAGGTYYAELWGGRTIPDVIGMAQDAAIEDLEQKAFAVEATSVPSDEPEGTVIGCEPACGSRVEEGSTVMLTVATPRLVPKVKGLSQQEAADALAAEGFTAIEYKEKKSNKDEGTVLSVNPKAGEEAKADTPITLTVAVPFTVPNVEGKSQDEAVKLLEDEGYHVSTDWYVTEDIEEGTAVSTDPEAGTKLDSGSDVTLYIAHSRGTELRELTASILPGATLTIDKVTYQVQDVKSTSYRGDGEVNYTVTAKKYEVVTLPFGLGEKTYYDDKVQTIEGGIVWDDNNEVSYASPAIRY